MSIFNRDLKKRNGLIPFIIGVYAISGAIGLQVLAWYIGEDISDAAWMVMFAISAVMILFGVALVGKSLRK